MINSTSEMIPILPNVPYPLGRHVHHDPLNAFHRALVSPPERALSPNKAWFSQVVWDQVESNCTIEAVTGMLHTAPYYHKFTDKMKFDEEAERVAAYRRFQKYDPPEWGTPHEGSATDSPYKGLREEGVITGWKWLFGEAELREYVTWFGPATVGTVWLNDMFDPLPTGFLPVSGAVAGGHEYRIVQYNRYLQAYRIINSWGKAWGQNGRAWIHASDMKSLLDQDGDAATIA